MDILYTYRRIILACIAASFLLVSCAKSYTDNEEYPDDNNQFYRDSMREWVISISNIAKSQNPDFIIIPQNCSPLLTDNGNSGVEIYAEFISSIDGIGQESISFGWDGYNISTEKTTKGDITELLNIAIDNNLTVISINYCDEDKKIEEAIRYDEKNGYISYVSPSIDLTDITTHVNNENTYNIFSLYDAENWLFMINPSKYKTKEEYITSLCSTNFDVIVIDAFLYDDIILTRGELDRLKIKANGAKRLVISYLSIGEAEDYRYYWKDEWHKDPPKWICEENINWKGNYPVEYWNEQWQNIIAIDEKSYLKRIINAGFDGVYLDIVDGYEMFEIED